MAALNSAANWSIQKRLEIRGLPDMRDWARRSKDTVIWFKTLYLLVRNTVSFGPKHCMFRTKRLYLSDENTVCFGRIPSRVWIA